MTDYENQEWPRVTDRKISVEGDMLWHNPNAGVTLSRFWLPMATRWRKFAISGRIVNTSGHSGMHPKPSCVRRLSFLGFGSSFGSVHKIFGMSKNCRRSSRSCTFAWTSCVLLVHRVAIVRPSCVHHVGSCDHRIYFVWPSATPGILSTRWQYDGHTELADGLEKATRRREGLRIAIVYPPCDTLWHFNCIAMGSRCHQRKSN